MSSWLLKCLHLLFLFLTFWLSNKCGCLLYIFWIDTLYCGIYNRVSKWTRTWTCVCTKFCWLCAEFSDFYMKTEKFLFFFHHFYLLASFFTFETKTLTAQKQQHLECLIYNNRLYTLKTWYFWFRLWPNFCFEDWTLYLN